MFVCIKGVEGIGKRMAEEVIGRHEWIRIQITHQSYLNADALLHGLAQAFATVGDNDLLKGFRKKRISISETLRLVEATK